MHPTFLQHFDDFLIFARQQPESLRLLLVFARQQTEFDGSQEPNQLAGGPGQLMPVAIVDKAPEHLQNYAQLQKEAEQMVGEWDAVFVGVLQGRGASPTVQEIDEGGEKMVQALREGHTDPFLLFDQAGVPLQLDMI